MPGPPAWQLASWVRYAGLVPLLLIAACAGMGPTDPEAEIAEPDASPETIVEPAVRSSYQQAVAVLQAGDLVSAEALLQRFVAEHPEYPGAHTNLAFIFRQTDRVPEAEEALDRALVLDPDFAPALNQLGIIRRQDGHFEEAEAAYLKAVTAQPDYALAHFNLGVLNDLYLRRPQTALAHYEQYQALTSETDDDVAMWIVDIRRRLGLEAQSARVE